jgi:hypothetical protein
VGAHCNFSVANFNVLVFILACADTGACREGKVHSYARVSKSRKLAKEAAYIYCQNLIKHFLIVKEDFEK